MLFLRAQLLAAIVVASALALGGVFAFARPVQRPSVLPPPPDHGLPYTKAVYSAAGVRAAFAATGIAFTVRSRSATGTTFGSLGDVLEVDAFADADTVARAGFWDYTVSGGRYVHFPRTCDTAIPDAERWRGNVRVIVSCRKAGSAASGWLRRADRALARLAR